MFQFYTYRFVLLIFVLVCIYWLYKRRYKTDKVVLIFPLVISTFFLVIAFMQAEMSLGVGFSLFAILSVLRFRSINLKLHVMVFAFVGITLAIVHAVLPKENNIFLFIADGIILLSYLLIINFFLNESHDGFDVVISYKVYKAWKTDEIKIQLEQVVNHKIRSYDIDEINVTVNQITFNVVI